MFGAYEKHADPKLPSQGVYFAVQNRKAETLIPLIEKIIAKGTTIRSDEWRAYARLKDLGYKHETVCHKRQFVTPDGINTNGIEGAWGRIRRSFPMHGVKKNFIHEYLWEFQWRTNSVHSFLDLAKLIMKHTELKYQELLRNYDDLNEAEPDSAEDEEKSGLFDDFPPDFESDNPGNGESASEYED